jgi:hypothetical protein
MKVLKLTISMASDQTVQICGPASLTLRILVAEAAINSW